MPEKQIFEDVEIFKSRNECDGSLTHISFYCNFQKVQKLNIYNKSFCVCNVAFYTYVRVLYSGLNSMKRVFYLLCRGQWTLYLASVIGIVKISFYLLFCAGSFRTFPSSIGRFNSASLDLYHSVLV